MKSASWTEVSKNISNISLTMKINNRETERFESLFDAVRRVMDRKQCSNQEATHFVRDNQFTMGTDRGIWLTI